MAILVTLPCSLYYCTYFNGKSLRDHIQICKNSFLQDFILFRTSADVIFITSVYLYFSGECGDACILGGRQTDLLVQKCMQPNIF